MKRNRSYIWHIIGAAIVVTLLANVGLFNHFHKLHTQSDPTPESVEQYYFTVRIGFVGVASELLILVVFAFFNYSWKDRLFTKHKLMLTILGNVVLLVLFIGMDMLIFKYGVKTHPNLTLNWFYLKDYLINHSLVLCIAIVAPYMLLRMEKAQKMERNLQQLKEEKATAELAALKDQINPHFFFNTMSTLSMVVRNETKASSLEFIDDISKTYRYSITASTADVVPLAKELEFITAYADVLQRRFGKKLTVAIEVSERLFEGTIPPMSLQLLVENAIRHNVITKERPLHITITDEGDGIWVRNNLQEQSGVQSLGVGLVNLENRYQLIASQGIRIEKTDTQFAVKIPVLL